MVCDDYNSLELQNEEIKYETIYKVVRAKVKKEGILYSLLLNDVKKIGGTKEYLDDILKKFYIVKNVNGAKKVFIDPIFSCPETIKVKMDTIKKPPLGQPMTKEKEEQIKRANEIIHGKTKKQKQKKYKQENIAKYNKPNKKQKELDRLADEYERKVKEYKETVKDENSKYDHVCYRFLNLAGEIIYVGRAENLVRRMESHARKGHLSATCYSRVYKVEFCTFNSEDDLDIAERYYISKFQPEYNVVFKDKKYFTISELDSRGWEEFLQGANILHGKW